MDFSSPHAYCMLCLSHILDLITFSIQCRGQRMGGAIIPLPQYEFMAWCSVKKAQGQLDVYM
jgi:hypothetical protein